MRSVRSKFIGHFNSFKFLALLTISMLTLSGYAQAQYTTDFVICLDASTSMSATDWKTEKDGTTAGLLSALDPHYLNGSIRVSVVQFPTSSGTNGNVARVVGPTIMDSLATLTTFNTAVEALAVPNGTRYTNIQSCIDVARSSMGCGTGAAGPGQKCPDDGIRRVIDISTDGNPTTRDDNLCTVSGSSNRNQRCAVQAAERAEAAGIDVINVIAVGNVDTNNAKA